MGSGSQSGKLAKGKEGKGGKMRRLGSQLVRGSLACKRRERKKGRKRGKGVKEGKRRQNEGKEDKEDSQAVSQQAD